MKKHPLQILEESTKTFKERNAVYGDSFDTFGNIAVALFPDGLVLKDAADFNRFAAFLNLLNKVQRYAQNFEDGGHPDSAHDAIVYSAILESLTKGEQP